MEGGVSMSTTYNTVFEVFLQKISDVFLGDLLSATPLLAESRMSGWLRSAIVKFDNCKSDLSNRSDSGKTFNITLSDYEIEILAYFMGYEWADPEIKNVLNLRQILGDAAFKLTSQANHLKELREFKKMMLDEAQYWKVQYSYVTSDPTATNTNPLSDLG